MNLNDFIQRAVAFFDKAETKVEAQAAEQAKQLTDARARIAELETAGAEKDKAIADLKAQAEPQAVKITNLEAELAAEKAKTTETLAGLGVKPADIPAATEAKPEDTAKKLLEDLAALKDPVERAHFYRKNKDAIRAASDAARR